MKVGFTGTKVGMSTRQMKALRILLLNTKITEFHHGDCVGADAEAHNIVRNFGKNTFIVIHPPTDCKLRAYCQGDLFKEPKQYLTRDECIVNNTDMLIAAPQGKERVRSGTWFTIRYAVKQKKRVFIIERDGSLTIR